MGLVGLLPIQDLLARLVLALALSVAVDMAVAEAMVYTDSWSRETGLQVLALVTWACASIQLETAFYRHLRRGRSMSPED